MTTTVLIANVEDEVAKRQHSMVIIIELRSPTRDPGRGRLSDTVDNNHDS